ncbi:trypsin-like serine peptidase [Mesorhizobium sp. BHbsci]
MGKYGWALLTAMFALTGVAHAQPGPEPAGDREVLNRTFSEFEEIGSNGSFIARTDARNPRGDAFRLYFDEIKTTSDRGFVVRIIGAEGILTEIPGEEFTKAEVYASHILVGSDVTVEVEAPSKPSGLSFRLATLHYEAPSGEPLSVTEPDQRRKTRNLPEASPMRIAARSVAKLTFQAEDGLEYLCSGFLIAPSRLLTNEHCINTEQRCNTALAIFGYLDDSANVEQVRCSSILRVDAGRDLALLQLEASAGSRWGVLSLAKAPPGLEASLYIPQHPGGRPQEVSIADCKLVETNAAGVSGPTDFANNCDTEGGASGSPVIDLTTNEVVGLHHWGFEPAPSQYQNLNRAVRIDEVRAVIDAVR